MALWERLDILVLYLFDRHKTHVWATYRFTDGGGIIGIVLVTLTVGDDELETDEAHVMPQLLHLPGLVVRALAGFHTNTTGRQLRDKG